MELDCKLVKKVHKPEFTGYFRDGRRRIDLVLVFGQMGNAKTEEIQIQFLMGALDVGLELEVEFGVMPKHLGLMFVKVHAPVELIAEYGKLYSEFKPFKRNHLEQFVANTGLLGWLMPDLRMPYEREWVQMIRIQYPEPDQYSTLERSRIVHRLMQLVRFGEHADHIGLHKLQSVGVVEDVFPLHDGPYFHLDTQLLTDVNGRQILFLEWIGHSNLLKSQPLHVIREYLGERIGFLFAFFELVNRMMLPVAALSLLVFVCGLVLDSTDEIVNNAACKKEKYTYLMWMSEVSYVYFTYTVAFAESFEKLERDYFDLPVCPHCDDLAACPFRNLTQYCDEVKVKTMLDNPYAIPFSFAVSLWGVLLYLLWKRREAYLYWIWEVNKTETENVMRPQYAFSSAGTSRGGSSSIYLKLQTTLKNVFKVLVILGTLSFYCFVFIALVLTAASAALRLHFKEFEEAWDFRKINYMIFILIATINALVTVMLEKVGRQLARVLVDLNIPRRPAAYEKELVLRMFTFSLTFNFGYLFYLSFVKGHLYTYPSNLRSGRENCGLLSCIDEICYAIIITIIAKHVFLGFGDLFIRKVTDYNRSTWVNTVVPCWEKEYVLNPVTDELIMEKFEILMIQLAFGTFFASMVPLASLAMVILNIWMIRRWAEELLLRSRRPLLTASWGLGCWNNVLQLLPFAAAACNALATALNSNIFDVNLHTRYFPERRFFADLTMSYFNLTHGVPYGNRSSYKDKYYFPDFCLFPGKWNRILKFYEDGQIDCVYDLFVPTVLKLYTNATQAEFFIAFMVMAVVSSMMLYHLLDQVPGDVAAAQEQERAVLQHVRQPGLRWRSVDKNDTENTE